MNGPSSSMSSNKRLKARINPPRRPTRNTDIYGELWPKLEQAIRQIYGMNSSGLSFEELYRAGYTLVISKKGHQLYQDVCNTVSAHLDEVAKQRIAAAFPTDKANLEECTRFLRALASFWNEHTHSMVMIRDILMYMDRVFVKAADVQPIYDAGMDIFRDTLLHSRKYAIQQQLLDVLLAMIARERGGEVVNAMEIRRVTQLLLQLPGAVANDVFSANISVYQRDFEKDFLQLTAEHYRSQADAALAVGDVAEYLRKTEKWLEEEASRADRYLCETTGNKLRSIIEEKVIIAHLTQLIKTERTGLRSMMANDKIENLNRMYRLFGLVEKGHQEMRDALFIFIKDCGQDINRVVAEVRKDKTADAPPPDAGTGEAQKSGRRQSPKERSAAQALQWVEQVLALQAKTDTILRDAFGDDKYFQISMSEAFAFFINENQQAVEYIALFFDENLQRGIKSKTEREIDAILDGAISLFRYLEDKDMFERYYKHHLSRRLLFSKSVSDDAERSMLARLKAECGVQYTTKMEGMFNDMKLSTEIMRKYRDTRDDEPTEDEDKVTRVDISVLVLTSTYWPVSPAADTCILPQLMRSSQQHFNDFYLSLYSGRKLMFQVNMGTVEVRARFGNKRHDLIVPTCTMAILMQFNTTDDWLSYEQLRAETGIAEEDLQRNLLALCSPKHPILCRDPPVAGHAKEMAAVSGASGHRFRFNQNFKSKLVRIRIMPAAPRLEQASERRTTVARINEERQIQTDACIVRIMKSRRQLDHNALVAETTKQLLVRFRPNPAIIKKRIESLIEREYLERSPNDLKTYHYLA